MQLRAGSVGFTTQTLVEAVKAAHQYQKRLYVTVNTFASDADIEALPDYARFLRDAGVDAVIVSDLGAISQIKKSVPELEVHVSTQANCQNAQSARIYYELGAKRVVLARELSIEQIAALRAKAPAGLELEAFIHGAMCMAYSGRCLISSYLTNRSGNQGACAQPCRWSYHLVEEKRPNEFFPVFEDEAGTSILSSHDLNCVSFLEALAQAGVVSFKIEGRMKTPYYVATVVGAYRGRMDGTLSIEQAKSELNCISHRPYSSGFYFGEMKTDSFNNGAYSQNAVYAGVVLGWENGRLTLEQRNRFAVGDTLEIVSPGQAARGFTVESIVNEQGEYQQAAPHPRQIVTVNCPYEVEAEDILRLRLRYE